MPFTKKVAVLYQSAPAPEKDGIIKPMKPGGYADSGADIAFALKRQNIEVLTPVQNPETETDLDWVFPDSSTGIQSAINVGAEILWLNTVLYEGHPIEKFIGKGIAVVGQNPENVDKFDDKLLTNRLLRRHNLTIPKSTVINAGNLADFRLDFPFPVVAKPVRGRGSQGVSVVGSMEELRHILREMFAGNDFGSVLYVEEFLAGEELTISVMPPGKYLADGREFLKNNYWALPPVRRFNHQNGVAPYNGTVAVVENSEVLDDERLNSEKIKSLCRDCETAAGLVGAKAPIRIDCRADSEGKFYLFDLNMKPNMTGASRPHRPDQDSLTALAARKFGWNFDALVLNMLMQYWPK